MTPKISLGIIKRCTSYEAAKEKIAQIKKNKKSEDDVSIF
jgi:hypothetical protein